MFYRRNGATLDLDGGRVVVGGARAQSLPETSIATAFGPEFSFAQPEHVDLGLGRQIGESLTSLKPRTDCASQSTRDQATCIRNARSVRGLKIRGGALRVPVLHIGVEAVCPIAGRSFLLKLTIVASREE
ncbi:hypothetical protein EVAR_77608_1 [Eumeta japonica]|uniref:Uncharacterized protein n=1 Tax=Eumeta variegata TaxID=151549 RepID=A0A4C1T6R1_EUMVA|nr:hypothetical protein EVAR_77608_1 [Eumeta japonica]